MGSEQFNNLLYSFYKASISSGVAKGNSYFIINLESDIMINDFLIYLEKVKNYSDNTITNYGEDLDLFYKYIDINRSKLI